MMDKTAIQILAYIAGLIGEDEWKKAVEMLNAEIEKAKKKKQEEKING